MAVKFQRISGPMRSLRLWALLSCVFALAACAPTTGETPERLRIAVLPDQSPELLRSQHDPLVAYLGQALGVPSELVPARDYPEISRLFDERKVDLVFFGGLTFVTARRFSGAIPLVTRDIDLRFTSTFLARQDATGNSIEDFGGKRFSFGSRQSTSGHLMPRHFLQARGIEPEAFFSEVRYSGAQDKTAQSVLSGDADLGAVNTFVLQWMIDNALLRRTDFKVVWVTPPYTNYVWAVRPGLNAAFRKRLLQAFLALSPDNPAHAVVLDGQSAGGFLAARNADFDRLEAIAEKHGLLKAP